MKLNKVQGVFFILVTLFLFVTFDLFIQLKKLKNNFGQKLKKSFSNIAFSTTRGCNFNINYILFKKIFYTL